LGDPFWLTVYWGVLNSGRISITENSIAQIIEEKIAVLFSEGEIIYGR